MPGADLPFLPLPFAHAARGSGAGPTTNGTAPHVDPARDAGDARDAETWQRLAKDRGEALRRIVAAGDAAAKASTFRSATGLIEVEPESWVEYRRATLAGGLELYPL